MEYTIENGIVYDNHITPNGSTGLVAIGNEEQYSITDTPSQTIYQWQKFNIATGIYENDTTNTTSINGITPTNGQVVIDKLLEVQAAALAKILALLNQTLLTGFSSNGNTFKYDQASQIDFLKLNVAIAEGYETFPVSIPNSNQANVSFTQDQYTQFKKDMAAFDETLQAKYDNLCNQVKACTSVTQIQAIPISFS